MSESNSAQAAEACKAICGRRWMGAVAFSILLQYLLLIVYLAFVNFSLIHPWIWITSTFLLLTSYTTHLSLLPLFLAVGVYGFFLGKIHMAKRSYYKSRFLWFWKESLTKLIFFFVHAFVGFLTALIYTSFLDDQYRYLLIRCKDDECINSNFTFLACIGISAGLFYFVQNYLRKEPEIEMPIIQQNFLVQLRPLLIIVLKESLMKAIVPTLSVALLFAFLGSKINEQFALMFDVSMENNLTTFWGMLTSVRVLCYGWLLFAQILANMQIMRCLLSILLTEKFEFVINKDPLNKAGNSGVLLADALGMSRLPVIQSLAAFDLYDLSISKSNKRRLEIFALSLPGGHPYNWQQISGQCLSMINSFIEELDESLNCMSPNVNTPAYCTALPPMPQPAKQLIRQMNQKLGIRPVRQCELSPVPVYTVEHGKSSPSQQYDIKNQWPKIVLEKCQNVFNYMVNSVRGLNYIFAEIAGAKTNFLLAQSQMYGFIAQGLANICGASLVEDNYGVVQVTLPEIIRTFLRLKHELDRLNSLNWNGKRQDPNVTMLRNAVKRSLYKICTDFGCYMQDIIEDRNELRRLDGYMNYQEI